MPHGALFFSMIEMLCNSLDTDATEIWVNIENSAEFDYLTIRDNGSKKISEDDLKLILDFNNKASSKRGFLRVSRGYLGNALKCILGYSYALAEDRKLPRALFRNYAHTRIRTPLVTARLRFTELTDRPHLSPPPPGLGR